MCLRYVKSKTIDLEGVTSEINCVKTATLGDKVKVLLGLNVTSPPDNINQEDSVNAICVHTSNTSVTSVCHSELSLISIMRECWKSLSIPLCMLTMMSTNQTC